MWDQQKPNFSSGTSYLRDISELFDYSAHFKHLAIHEISIGNG